MARDQPVGAIASNKWLQMVAGQIIGKVLRSMAALRIPDAPQQEH
jgi:hypothetical protein